MKSEFCDAFFLENHFAYNVQGEMRTDWDVVTDGIDSAGDVRWGSDVLSYDVPVV